MGVSLALSEGVRAASDSERRINEAYLLRIKPIFQKKCFDCHSDQTHYPSYYKYPGIQQWIDSDIQEAREKIDFSKDYPFLTRSNAVGAGKSIELLDSIKKELDEGEMPPFLYRWAHPDSMVLPEEQRLIYDWVDWAKNQLKASSN